MLQQVTFYNWIESYIGPDFSLVEAQEVWQKQNLLTNICAIPFVLIAGKVADKISAKVLIPGALIF